MTEHHSAFRDYVRELPHQWILDNLISGSGGSRGIVSSVMIREAVEKFTAKPALIKRFKALPDELRVKCSQIYLMGGNGLSLDLAEAYSKEPLLSSLLVFAAQNGEDWGGGTPVRLFGFDEFEPVLRPLMAEVLAGECVSGAECAPQTAGCPWRPLNDAAAVCSLAFHGVLKRSIHGGLSRSALNALRKLVHDPTLTGKSVPEEGVPGHPAGVLIGYCLHEGLIADAGRDYRFNGHRFADWSKRSLKERMGRLESYAGEFLGGFGLGLLRELLGRGAGHWAAANPLVPEAGRQVLALALNALEFLGRLHTNHPHGAGALRFVPHKEAGGDIDKLYSELHKRDTVVMSDFSALIPQEASPSELAEFSKTGLLAAFDKVYKGNITKASVSNSLSMGTDADQIRGWLRDRRAPANVAKTVDEWIREFSRLFVTRDASLVASEERVAKAISGFEPLRKHLVKVSAHTVFRIRPGSERKVLDTLEKMGFDTRAPGGGDEILAHETYGKKDGGKHAHSDHADVADAKADAGHEDYQPIKEPSADKKPWKPLTDFSSDITADDPLPMMRRTKYGSGLKSLDITEMIHVVDYALLTGYSLVIDYAGSASIKENIYTVSPVNIDKGIDAAVEAEIPSVRGRKRFYLNKINRIGVAAQ